MVDTFESAGTFSPADEFVEQANVTDPSIYEAFERNWPECWERAASFLDWERPYDSVLEPTEESPYYQWFVGGSVNAADNCVDRHVRAGRGDNPALRWIRENGETRTYTYADLQTEVSEMAAVFRSLGVKAGEPVSLYLPRIPELPIAMLATARLGAPHVVVFAEYSADVLASIMQETRAETLVTCDGYVMDDEFHALASEASVGIDALDWDVTAVTIEHTGMETSFGRDYDSVRERHRDATVDTVVCDSQNPLFICYASGPTGEPIGMKHVTGEYLSYVAWTTHAVLDVELGDTLWCPAGIEWITGHSYVVYGPLTIGATTVLYEGAPAYPDKHRPWEIIENNDVTQFYTTPTAIRTFMDWGVSYPAAHDLSSLRLLGTVGQRIDPDTWEWFYEHIGDERCPIVDTWYQAETGGITVSTLPGVCDMKPGSVGPPLPGIDATIVDANGETVEPGEAGYLVFDRPWPGFFRPVGATDGQATELWTEFGDPGYEWVYFSEDGAVRDENGHITVLGRLDDVISVGYYSKNRVHVNEIERTIETVDTVEAVAVVCGEHDIKGEAPYAFVVVDDDAPRDIHALITDTVEHNLAASARPEEVYLVAELPRTYAGGVLRQVLEDLLNGERLGDTGLLRNPSVLDRIAVEIRHRCSTADIQ